MVKVQQHLKQDIDLSLVKVEALKCFFKLLFFSHEYLHLFIKILLSKFMVIIVIFFISSSKVDGQHFGQH